WASGDYAVAKCVDEYQEMYQPALPGEFRDAGRPTRMTPLYDTLKAQGAIFGDTFGWERAKWFAPAGVSEEYGFRRSNWFSTVAAECRAVREQVGVLDLSSFAKYEITGKDVLALLERVCANRVPGRDGAVVLTQMLTTLGGIECEATVTRLGENHYYLLSGAVAELHDLDWLVQHVEANEDVSVTNVTDDYGVLVLSGPNSREVLSELTDVGLTNEDGFTWMSAREITVAGVPARALRVSYVGELGWELHVSMSQMKPLYDALMKAGEGHGIKNFGTYALNALRMEKAYKAWGSELTTEISLVEADMLRFARKGGGYIGADVVEQKRRDGVATYLVYCAVEAADADVMGNEPVYAGDKVIGITTSGAYGHCVEQSLAFAYVDPGYDAPGSVFDIEILGERRRARVLAEAAWDPRNERLRA
ncbi:MAG: aminomethyltransferase family protein, partial [Arenicellales bacterium]|nr:aminomethyltransferase family protein [Arenicellales bacterium]